MSSISECPQEVPPFEGNPGLVVLGHIQPQLGNVSIVVSVEGEGVVAHTSTDNSGSYRLVDHVI